MYFGDIIEVSEQVRHADLVVDCFAVEVAGKPVVLQNTIWQAIGKVVFDGLEAPVVGVEDESEVIVLPDPHPMVFTVHFHVCFISAYKDRLNNALFDLLIMWPCFLHQSAQNVVDATCADGQAQHIAQELLHSFVRQVLPCVQVSLSATLHPDHTAPQWLRALENHSRWYGRNCIAC